MKSLNLFHKIIKTIQKNRGNELNFDSADLLYYSLQKTSLNRKGSSYTESPEWPKNKKAAINSKSNDNNCFQYALTVALNY